MIHHLAVAMLMQAAPAAPPAAAPAPAYGAAVTLADAQAIVARATAAARVRGFRMAVAVVDTSGELVAFARMDDTQFASIKIAQAKAASAARFRASTAGFEERAQGGRIVILALEGAVPVAGGVPIVASGRIVGAIGVSGASSAQDDEIARAALTGR